MTLDEAKRLLAPATIFWPGQVTPETVLGYHANYLHRISPETAAEAFQRLTETSPFFPKLSEVKAQINAVLTERAYTRGAQHQLEPAKGLTGRAALHDVIRRLQAGQHVPIRDENGHDTGRTLTPTIGLPLLRRMARQPLATSDVAA